MKNNRSRKAGFTLIEIMIVVAIIGLLAAVAIPNFVRSRIKSQQNACIENLKKYEAATQIYALEKKLPPTDSYTMDDLKEFIRLDSNNQLPSCPAKGIYEPGDTIADLPKCTVAGHTL